MREPSRRLLRLRIRTWNLFHGNVSPPQRTGYLEQMVRLARADGPDVLCFQELPVWALGRLEGWTGMTAIGAVAARPMLGPLPSTAAIGRVLTELDHERLRSAFTGQANAVLVRRELRVLDTGWVVLNPLAYRRLQARRLGLGIVPRLAWGKERRVCQAVRIGLDENRTLVIGNLHSTGYRPDKRLADAELLRAATFLDGTSRPGEPLALCGDFNLSLRNSRALHSLLDEGWGFHGASATGIDHVLVRGLDSTPPRRWPDERRRVDGLLLSDHAPVEVTVT